MRSSRRGHRRRTRTLSRRTYTALLRRAILTGNMMLEAIDQLYIPVFKSWRLNKRMYGGLQGLNKVETVEKHGKDQVLIGRQSFDVPPPEIDEKTECLQDVMARAERIGSRTWSRCSGRAEPSWWRRTETRFAPSSSTWTDPRTR